MFLLWDRPRLSLFAEIDQDDTNWFVTLKDIGPDVGPNGT